MSGKLKALMEIDRQVREGRRPTADTLASDLGLTRRVLFYYRKELLRMGAPLAWRDGWIYTERNWCIPGAYLTDRELELLKKAVGKLSGEERRRALGITKRLERITT